MVYNVSGFAFGMYGIEVSSVDEICALLGFDAMYNVNSVPTFRGRSFHLEGSRSY